jgi:superfamily I DNA and/or RNA helicase
VGTYQRAGARNNRQEAEAIVAFIRQHFLSDQAPIKSVGVVTFSQAQQKLVEDLLDAARRQDPALDHSIQAQRQEPLFVKNLENVQGDERDIILFSICYGPDETGRVSMNFGPLNRDGGHRRLNVAITRAKTQVHIFSTLHPDQFDLSRTKARGITDLKHYLQFAIQGPSALVAQTAPTGLGPCPHTSNLGIKARPSPKIFANT